mmetsp:Transcript_1016/g.2171  ORF Transcript_1016/g.2171 Transcript_1016/m.2171 type:complete len:106 (+) Transcript_1016:160-477(+)
MGNCCPCPGGDDPAAFRGEGQRLGAASDHAPLTRPPAAGTIDRDAPPARDPNLTEDDRDRLRRERAAAAEARLKKAGAVVRPKKKPAATGGGLGEGKNMMAWSVK